MQVLLTTVGPSNVIIDDLDGRTFVHPTADLDLLSEFSAYDLYNSLSLQTAITSNIITLKDEQGQSITNIEVDLSSIRQITTQSPIFNANKIQNKLVNLVSLFDQRVLTYDLSSDTFILTDKFTGSSFSHVTDDGKSTTTSNSYQDKLTYNINVNPGTYYVSWYCEGWNEDAGSGIEIEFRLDTEKVAEVYFYNNSGEDKAFKPFGGYKVLSLNGSHILNLCYKTKSGGTALIRHAITSLWRVS